MKKKKCEKLRERERKKPSKRKVVDAHKGGRRKKKQDVVQ